MEHLSAEFAHYKFPVIILIKVIVIFAIVVDVVIDIIPDVVFVVNIAVISTERTMCYYSNCFDFVRQGAEFRHIINHFQRS